MVSTYVSKILSDFVALQTVRQNKEMEDRIEYEIERRVRAEQAQITMFDHCCRFAEQEDYDDWFYAYIEAGNIPTAISTSSITSDMRYGVNGWEPAWFVAERSFNLVPLYGSALAHIIVPRGIHVSGEAGHSDIYYWDGLRVVGNHVPYFQKR